MKKLGSWEALCHTVPHNLLIIIVIKNFFWPYKCNHIMLFYARSSWARLNMPLQPMKPRLYDKKAIYKPCILPRGQWTPYNYNTRMPNKHMSNWWTKMWLKLVTVTLKIIQNHFKWFSLRHRWVPQLSWCKHQDQEVTSSNLAYHTIKKCPPQFRHYFIIYNKTCWIFKTYVS